MIKNIFKISIICFVVNLMSINLYASTQMKYPKVQIIEYCEDSVGMDEQDGFIPEIQEMLAKNTEQVCHDRTKVLTKSIKKHLRKKSIPIVDQNGELIIEVRILETKQVKTIDPIVIEKVSLKGVFSQKNLFNFEFDQSDQNNKKSSKQIGEILANKIMERINDEN